MSNESKNPATPKAIDPADVELRQVSLKLALRYHIHLGTDDDDAVLETAGRFAAFLKAEPSGEADAPRGS